MTIPRLYIPQTLATGTVCRATPDQARYVSAVLRMKEGDRLLLFNGSGWEYDAVIRGRAAEKIDLEVIGRHRLAGAEAHITLCQAVPKAEKMDNIVRHATELGVERIIPFFAERSIPRWKPERFSLKRERWRKIAIEASRQCHRTDVPEIGEIVAFEPMLHVPPEGGLRLIPWEGETEVRLHEVLRNPAYAETKDFRLVIGPEGGFSMEEIELARQAGFQPVSLGKRVLRVETASLAALAILQYEREAREMPSAV